MIRFCQGCDQERTDTSWSDTFRTRLCVDCYNLRCDEIPENGPLPEYREMLDASDLRDA